MTTQAEKQQAARLVWMLYYNRTLYEQGVISEKEFGRMKLRIQEKYSPRDKK